MRILHISTGFKNSSVFLVSIASLGKIPGPNHCNITLIKKMHNVSVSKYYIYNIMLYNFKRPTSVVKNN